MVVVDVQCDYLKETLGNVRQGHADIAALEESLQDHRREDPARLPGADRDDRAPGHHRIRRLPDHEEGLREARHRRRTRSSPTPTSGSCRAGSTSPPSGTSGGSAAASTTRPASGWRSSSREVLNVEKFPLTVLDRPIESETCKIVENSYRATILAFLNEWSLFAERNGVDLIKVIQAIKVRPTHTNMIFPGPGIGGYCLPKDGGLGVWAYQHPHGLRRRHLQDHARWRSTSTTPAPSTRPSSSATPCATWARSSPPPRSLLLGASYREDVGDTRYSGSEVVVRKLTEMGAEIARPRPLREALVGAREAGDLPRPRPLLGALLPQPGAASASCGCSRTWPTPSRGPTPWSSPCATRPT